MYRTLAESNSTRNYLQLCENVRISVELTLSPVHFNRFIFFCRCLEASDSLGIPYVEEANVPDAPPATAFRADMTIDRQMHRHSTFDAYLPDDIAGLRSSRLKICTGTVVNSLDVQRAGDKLKVRGVWLEPETTGSKRRYYVRARREVILCSGTIGSPQLLLLRYA